MQDGNTLDNELEVVEGMNLGRGYISPYFVTDPKTQKCVCITFARSNCEVYFSINFINCPCGLPSFTHLVHTFIVFLGLGLNVSLC